VNSSHILVKAKSGLILSLAVCLLGLPTLGAEADAVTKDSLNVQVLPPAAAGTQTEPVMRPPRRERRPVVHDESEMDLDYLKGRRERFQNMQNTGFGLLMGGIGCAGGGMLLMITGINQAERSNDPYDDNGGSSDDGLGMFLIGYLAVIASPGLIIPGIILNRVGNSRKRRYDSMIEDHPDRVSLNVGINSLSLSYTF
jgi:hypothetical protein